MPETISELTLLGETVTEEFEFLEVVTNTPRFADTTSGLPIFVVTGFRPEIIKKLYENLIYPTFEARLPETIDSIENVATQLVKVNNIKMFINIISFLFVNNIEK